MYSYQISIPPYEVFINQNINYFKKKILFEKIKIGWFDYGSPSYTVSYFESWVYFGKKKVKMKDLLPVNQRFNYSNDLLRIIWNV